MLKLYLAGVAAFCAAVFLHSAAASTCGALTTTDCGWALIGGTGAFQPCNGQGVPTQLATSTCDTFPLVCYGVLPLDQCKDKCASDPQCNGLYWRANNQECFPKEVPGACADYAAKPAGCPTPAGTSPPLSAWQFHILCDCASPAVVSPVPPGGALNCPSAWGWTTLGVVGGCALVYILGGLGWNAKTNGTPSMPHPDFWMAAWALVLDGGVFASNQLAKSRQSDDTDYKSVGPAADLTRRKCTSKPEEDSGESGGAGSDDGLIG
jgi:hypothetical protein